MRAYNNKEEECRIGQQEKWTVVLRGYFVLKTEEI